MRLSEAIRKGAAVTGPFRGDYFRFKDDRLHTCALGAAMYALFRPKAGEFGGVVDRAFEHFEELRHRTARCPACGLETDELAVVIAHLNDDHQWARLDIADWVETLESESVPVPLDDPSPCNAGALVRAEVSAEAVPSL